MTIVDVLEQNSRSYGDEICLVEINPEIKEDRRVTWKEYELIEPNPKVHYRREITWGVFDEKANRFANLLISRGIKKNDKVAILLMNCLEWLPIYFGILKTGAIAVPLNFRYSSDEIEYCVNLAEADILIFGPEFIGRVEAIDLHSGVVTVDFDGHRAEYTPDMMNQLEPAYAITVHKAQGSEYRAVILSAVEAAPMLLTRGVLYTAMTRAKELLILVGDDQVVARMAANDRQQRRYSGLRARLAKG